MNALSVILIGYVIFCNNYFNVQITGQQHLYVVFPKVFPEYHPLCVFDFIDPSFEECWYLIWMQTFEF